MCVVDGLEHRRTVMGNHPAGPLLKHRTCVELSNTPMQSHLCLLACFDSPLGWTDSEGDTCYSYMVNDWCTSNGDFGASWDPIWGTFADYANHGKDATQVCCDCGGGSTGTLRYSLAATITLGEGGVGVGGNFDSILRQKLIMSSTMLPNPT